MDITTYALSKKIAAHALSGVQSMSVSGQTLTINTKDSGVLTITFPTPKDGVSVTDIDVNANNQIVFTMSDGTEFISGKVPTVKGDKGDPGFSPIITENVDNTDKIYKLDITTADSTFTTPNLKGADGQGGTGGGEENKIDSISVNGVNVAIDENKNVDITVPSIEGLTKDEDLATVAKSGSYEDLSNKPTIPDITGLATETYVDNKVADYTKTVDLADVATSGSYNDLADKPTIPSLDGYAKTSEIPSKVSELENDSNYLSSIPEEYVTETELEAKGYLTEHQDISGKVDKVEGKSLISDAEIARLASVDNYDDTDIKAEIAKKADTTAIPSKVSELTNDSNYQTAEQVNSTVTTEIAKVVADAPEDFDTLKEMSDWIAGHEDDASAMNSAISDNKTAITALQTGKADKSEIPTTVAELTDSADYAKTADIPTSLPANGGNSDTVNGHTVNSDVPANAKFTDTVYDDSSLSSKVTQNTNDISELKTADNVLSSRIDAFTSLTEGSTTGDVELQDIRVKADGTTATSAGNAVREQFNELKSNVVLLDNLLKKTLAQEYDLKIAIDNMFKCAAYDSNSNYASAYENFKIACGLSDILYISAVFNGESAIAGTDAKDLDITVIGHYVDGETITLTGWKISGTVMVGTNIFTIVLGEFTTTVSVTGVKEPIPSEYTRCSYIKNSGKQYIKIPTKNMIAGTDKFIADFEINEDAGNDTMVFGGYTGNGTGRLGLNWKDGYINYNGANNWVYSQSGFELSPNIRAVAILDTKNGIAQLGESTSEFIPKSYTSSILCIFGYYNPTNTAQNKISMTLYRFKQYRNDELFTDLVPCLRNSDNVAGLYDLVDGVFYANAGSGTFEYEVASWA